MATIPREIAYQANSYVKRPTLVEAIQLHSENILHVKNFLGPAAVALQYKYINGTARATLTVAWPQNEIYIEEGDFIIRDGETGVLSVCKALKFEDDYSLVRNEMEVPLLERAQQCAREVTKERDLDAEREAQYKRLRSMESPLPPIWKLFIAASVGFIFGVLAVYSEQLRAALFR